MEGEVKGHDGDKGGSLGSVPVAGMGRGQGQAEGKAGLPCSPHSNPGELESLCCPGLHPKWGLPARPWRPLGSARAAGCPQGGRLTQWRAGVCWLPLSVALTGMLSSVAGSSSEMGTLKSRGALWDLGETGSA